jgi:lipid A 3-O-deacylase
MPDNQAVSFSSAQLNRLCRVIVGCNNFMSHFCKFQEKTVKATFIAVVLLSTFALAQSQTPTVQTSDTAKEKKSEKKPAGVNKDSQEVSPHTVVNKGNWNLGAWVQGGSGIGKHSDTQFVYFGGRIGKILTAEHGPGFTKGTLEYAADIIPFEFVKQPPFNAYGAGFNPVVLKWNFTSAKKIIPFLELAGGVLFTNNDVPVTTNTVNFTPQGGIGFHFLRENKKQAVTASIKYLHVSNAKLASHNQGVNASVIFGLGYTWFKR